MPSHNWDVIFRCDIHTVNALKPQVVAWLQCRLYAGGFELELVSELKFYELS